MRRIIRRLLPARRRPAAPAAPGSRTAGPANASLHALTVAALALPGLTPSPALAAEGDEAGFQYGHYQEGGGANSHFRDTGNSIQVDSLQAVASTRLLDRIRLLFNYTQDTWSGATPIAAVPAGSLARTDNIAGASPFWSITNALASFDPKTGVATYIDPQTGQSFDTTETVQVMAFASPEIRKQGDFNLAYEWDEAAVNGGAGVSIENDYDAWFANFGGRMDFNQKRTTVTAGMSYTNSSIDATRFAHSVVGSVTPNPDQVQGVRQDQAMGLNLVQVLDKSSIVEAGLGYTHSTGYLSNPYKQSVFFAPIDAPQLNSPDPITGAYSSLAIAKFDNRPRLRDQFNFNTRYVRYFDAVDGALHLDYRFYHDNWGINAHTFEASWGQPVGNGWTIRPRVRYYTQGAAHFYSPYFVFDQTLSFRDYLSYVQKGNTSELFFPAHWSSDYRLSGYGALSGGVTATKQFARGIKFQAGLEYYRHSGAMKLGGGGEGAFTNFNFFLLNAAVSVDLSARAKLTEDENSHARHAGHGGHANHPGSPFPAGVMFAHMMPNADDVMVGYRYMWSVQSGNMVHGSHPVTDAEVIARGCGGTPCSITPREMNMHMHMLDIMYAPTDWLNLMIMPTFMDMNMSLRALEGVPAGGGGHAGHTDHSGHLNRTQATGGIGDTGFYGLVKLFDIPNHHMHLSLGFSAPTGDVKQKVSGEFFTHYMMQLGSGTWDFRPSLTYTGYLDDWSWGTQFSGVKRPNDRNVSGYVLGDVFQSTAWTSYQLTDWLSANVRGAYTRQFRILGKYNGPHFEDGPMDFPQNYGGRVWEVGFGLNADVKSGELKGNSLSVEWLQPVESNVNGYQLKPDGMLSATWTLAF